MFLRSKLLSKVAQIRRRGLMEVILFRIFPRYVTQVWYTFNISTVSRRCPRKSGQTAEQGTKRKSIGYRIRLLQTAVAMTVLIAARNFLEQQWEIVNLMLDYWYLCAYPSLFVSILVFTLHAIIYAHSMSKLNLLSMGLLIPWHTRFKLRRRHCVMHLSEKIPLNNVPLHPGIKVI